MLLDAARSKEESGNDTDELMDSAQLKVGTVLDNLWKLDALLGVGATAAVYAARRRNGQRAAIKLLHPHYSVHEHVRARLRREARVAQLIDHPGVVATRGQGSCKQGGMFLVMELLEGETLDSHLRRRGCLPASEALWVAYYMLDVLAKAHAKGIVHRDIKPENVFLTRTGHLKVLDFGVAGFRQAPSDPGLTGARTLLGTPGFMAPEQALALHDEVDARSDLWSVGATLFTLLTGRSVHSDACTGNELLIYAATKPAPSLATLLPDASPELVRCVDRALAFDKLDRWPNAKAMQDAIRAILEKEAPGVLRPLPTAKMEATYRRKRGSRSNAPKFSWREWLRLRQARRPSLSFAVLGIVAAMALCAWACGRPSSKNAPLAHSADLAPAPGTTDWIIEFAAATMDVSPPHSVIGPSRARRARPPSHRNPSAGPRDRRDGFTGR